MLKVTRPTADQIDIEVRGQIDAEMMRDGLDTLIALSEDMQHGRMIYTIADFAWPSVAAIGVEMQRLPRLFSLLGKFDKCAVLCDAAWLRMMAEVEGVLLPGFEIKGFPSEERTAADAWLKSGG